MGGTITGVEKQATEWKAMISWGHVEWEVPESDWQVEGQRWWDLRVGTVRAGLLNSEVHTDHLETSFKRRFRFPGLGWGLTFYPSRVQVVLMLL